VGSYVLSIDQGTTSSRAILFDHAGRVRAIAQREFEQIFPKPGWVEHDPRVILATEMAVVSEALVSGRVSPGEVVCAGVSNQRETTIIWNRHTGEPVYNAIVWQCRRTAVYLERLLGNTDWPRRIQEKTGLIPDAYFSASKIAWILDNVEGARAAAEAGDLLFGTVDTWLTWNLNGGRLHATDYTNASRTMLFNIHSLTWDEELLRLFNIPSSLMPEVRPSSGSFGMIDIPLLSIRVPIMGVAGDQQAALFGQGCFSAGEAKNTYGTGCFLLLNTGDVPVSSQKGILTTLAASTSSEGRPQYVLEGSVFVAGALMKWLSEELGILPDVAESSALASSVETSDGVYIVPAFTGLGAPWWNPYARGAIVGLTRGTTRAHIVRAALEALAYQLHDILVVMNEDSGIDLSLLCVDGGVSGNDFLMQFQADILATPVKRAQHIETTALGAAALAGLASGFWESLDEIHKLNEGGVMFTPHEDADGKRARRLLGWKRAVDSVLTYADGCEEHFEAR
jgi:glycerol kinase